MKLETITLLDVDYQPSILSAIVSQYDDNSRQLNFILTKNKEPISLSSTCKARCWFVKPDKNVVFKDCVIENNKIKLVFDDQMTMVSGRALGQIIISDSADSSVFMSLKFRVLINGSLIDNEEIVSTSEWSSLMDALLTVDSYKSAINTINEFINSIATFEEVSEYLKI